MAEPRTKSLLSRVLLVVVGGLAIGAAAGGIALRRDRLPEPSASDPLSLAAPGEADERAAPPEAPTEQAPAGAAHSNEEMVVAPTGIPKDQVPKTLGERSGWKALTQRLPPMPGAQVLVPIGDSMVANGVPMNLASYEIDKDAVDVLTFYGHHFKQMGWPYNGVEDSAKYVPYPALSATDPDTDLQMTVMVLEHPENGAKRSTVILGLADMREARDPMASEYGDLPRYPGSQPLVMRATDHELESLTVTFQSADGADRVEQYYREEMPKYGYQLLPTDPGDPTGDGKTTVRFAGRDRIWSLTIAKPEEGAGETLVTALASPSRSSP